MCARFLSPSDAIDVAGHLTCLTDEHDKVKQEIEDSIRERRGRPGYAHARLYQTWTTNDDVRFAIRAQSTTQIRHVSCMWMCAQSQLHRYDVSVCLMNYMPDKNK